MIDNGWLTINGIQVRRLSEFNPVQSNLSDAERLSDSNNVFQMEPGRTLFIMMRVCNDAVLCTNKTLGSVIIMDNSTKLETSLNGEAIRIRYTPGGGAGRKKRAVGDNLVIETPSSKCKLLCLIMIYKDNYPNDVFLYVVRELIFLSGRWNFAQVVMPPSLGLRRD